MPRASQQTVEGLERQQACSQAVRQADGWAPPALPPQRQQRTCCVACSPLPSPSARARCCHLRCCGRAVASERRPLALGSAGRRVVLAGAARARAQVHCCIVLEMMRIDWRQRVDGERLQARHCKGAACTISGLAGGHPGGGLAGHACAVARHPHRCSQTYCSSAQPRSLPSRTPFRDGRPGKPGLLCGPLAVPT